MDRYIVELERALLRGEAIDLAPGALVASGVATRQALDRYLEAIEYLSRQMGEGIRKNASDITKGRAIFERLWVSRPLRYEPQGRFRLTDVLDAQVGTGDRVGNCLGLTVLYNVLAQPLGLKVRAAYLERAFGRGPHTFSVLEVGKRTVDIENILTDGFDCRAHRRAVGRIEWGDREIIADIYHSIGSESAASGDWAGAIESYDKSLALNPHYNRARLNKGIALMESGRPDEAAEWLRSPDRRV